MPALQRGVTVRKAHGPAPPGRASVHLARKLDEAEMPIARQVRAHIMWDPTIASLGDFF